MSGYMESQTGFPPGFGWGDSNPSTPSSTPSCVGNMGIYPNPVVKYPAAPSTPPTPPSYLNFMGNTCHNPMYTCPTTPSTPHTPSSYTNSSRHFSAPSTPTRSLGNTHTHVPEQPANAQDDYVCLPLPVQMSILSKMQNIMEHACYIFAQQHLPQILIKKGWDCPEAGELNLWMHNFGAGNNVQTLISLAQTYCISVPVPALMESAKQIRHTAVHRNKVTVPHLVMLMDHAVAFGTILGVSDDLNKLTEIRSFAKMKITQLENATNEAGKDIIQFCNRI
ncbi:ubiquinol-cytochrome-c reductase cytochrome c1 [Fusarium longipes]|uniref:Ubiquinol-cytochrome-c reductase cytochrome c1 n=1 Tax=Fusarium longipes TaxID=694270 RepID=A0A395T128_9HYPO|nr:ubiquinol-cytochrome-c reductase cytochrome c1 [Fusarium longipes]